MTAPSYADGARDTVPPSGGDETSDPLTAEATLAAIGLGPILAGKPRFNQAQQHAVAMLPERIRRAVLRFMSGEKDEVSDPPPFDYDEARALLDADDDTNEARIAALHSLLPLELGTDVEHAATGIVQQLAESLPRLVWSSSAKVHADPPEPFSLGRFERRWAVAMDPLIVLRNLSEGILTPDEVEALAAFYPSLYEMILGVADEALATMKARRSEGWDLTEEQDRGFKTLVQAPTFDPELAADYVNLAQSQPAPLPRASGGSKAVKGPEEQLPGQKL